MSKTIGLYPDIILGTDTRRLCLSKLGSNLHHVINVSPEQYIIEGNTITFFPGEEPDHDVISTLVERGFAYRLLEKPSSFSDNGLHMIQRDDSVENELYQYFTITFILDRISALPAFHFPHIRGTEHKFSDGDLDIGHVRKRLSEIKYFRKIRLISNNILRHTDILLMEELKDKEIEVFVGQDYYLRHIKELNTFSRQLHIIVYIDDIRKFNECGDIPHTNNVSVSYFCQIGSDEDLDLFLESNIKAIPFPSPDAPETVLHSLLDYSEEDIPQIPMTKRDQFLKKAINKLFYGNTIIDNNGNINSYPFCNYEANSEESFGTVVKKLADNIFWRLRRSDYFEKCKECAFVDLCPPISNYEINAKQTFCTD